MNWVFQSAFLKALGWSLLDSLWQMSILWLIYLLLTQNGKRFTSLLRHNLAVLSLAGGTLWFMISLALNYQVAVNQPAATTVFQSEVSTGEGSAISGLSSSIEPALPYLSITYLAFLLFLFIRFFIQFREMKKLYTSSRRKPGPEWRLFLRKTATVLGIKKDVGVWISELVDTPLTIGFWKPIILLPVAAVNGLTVEQTESVIIHELYHIKRNDYVVNLLIAVLDLLLFFNPFSRLLTDAIKKERENSCDDLVLQFRYDARSYANALLLLEQNRVQKPVLSIAATGKDRYFLLNRVRRMLCRENTSTSVSFGIIAALFTALLIGLIGYYNPGNVIVKKLRETNAFVSARPSNPEISRELLTSIEASPKSRTMVPDIKSETADEATETEIIRPEDLSDYYSFESEEDDAPTGSIINYVQTAPEIREFSLSQTEPVVPAPVYSSQYPFVPSNSFTFYHIEDTSLPKKQVITFSEKKAREAMEQSLMAIDQIDWQKLENKLGKVNVTKLQKELKKALEEVDWKKINEELGSSLQETMEANQEYRIQLEKLHELRSDKAHQLKKIQEKVLEDQLKKAECPENKQTAPRRKIVVI